MYCSLQLIRIGVLHGNSQAIGKPLLPTIVDAVQRIRHYQVNKFSKGWYKLLPGKVR